MTESYPVVGADEIGWLTEAQMIEVDRVMIDDLGIQLIQMMENAGRNLARLVLDRTAPGSVVVLAGSGGNGGGGLVAARHLANADVAVEVLLSRPPAEIGGVPGHQLDILQRMDVPCSAADALPPTDVVIDALIGYSLSGAPRGRTAALIESLANMDAEVIALDTPSGLDVTTGATPGVVATAAATLTLALPKRGLRDATVVGDLYVADISVPPHVMASIGAAAPDFRPSPILEVTEGRT